MTTQKFFLALGMFGLIIAEAMAQKTCSSASSEWQSSTPLTSSAGTTVIIKKPAAKLVSGPTGSVATAAKPVASKMDPLASVLGLSPAQAAQFNVVLADRQNQLKDLMASSQLSAEAKAMARNDIFDAANARIKNILTSEQFSRYVALAPTHRYLPGQRPAATSASATSSSASASSASVSSSSKASN